MVVEKSAVKNLWCIRLNSGDDVLLSLSEAVKKHGINNAIIIAGTGSTVNCHYHVVVTSDFPFKNVDIKKENPSDILNINGLVINGRVHAHITHSDKEIAYGGHLEEGVKVCSFLSITLAEVDIDLEHWDTVGKGAIEELRKK